MKQYLRPLSLVALPKMIIIGFYVWIFSGIGGGVIETSVAFMLLACVAGREIGLIMDVMRLGSPWNSDEFNQSALFQWAVGLVTVTIMTKGMMVNQIVEALMWCLIAGWVAWLGMDEYNRSQPQS